MLKQGLAQERLGDVSMSQLPPQSTLPQWSRNNTLDKARYPKPFLKDKLQPIESRRNMEGDDKELDVSGMNPAQRVQYLERSLQFLRQQHSDVLRALHGEVEGLKRENKDLLHKVVMIQKNQQLQQQQQQSSGDSSGSVTKSKSAAREEGLDDVKVIFLEEEIKELKHALRETRNKNTYMQQRLEQSEEARKRQQAMLESMKQQMSQNGMQAESGQDMPDMMGHMADHHSMHKAGAQPQSLSELQAVIRQLQQVNERQAHELEGLKSDLRDVLYSHKWTPDAYLLAKAYVSEDDKKSVSGVGSKSALPKISVKDRGQPLSEVAFIQDTASLPALTQSVGNKAVERQKRTLMLQKAKLRKQTVPE